MAVYVLNGNMGPVFKLKEVMIRGWIKNETITVSQCQSVILSFRAEKELRALKIKLHHEEIHVH